MKSLMVAAIPLAALFLAAPAHADPVQPACVTPDGTPCAPVPAGCVQENGLPCSPSLPDLNAACVRNPVVCMWLTRF
jgi:hypothetical protein